MKQEIKDGIIKLTAETFQDIDALTGNANSLIREGFISEVYTTRDESTNDYLETVIKYKPDQNWIK